MKELTIDDYDDLYRKPRRGNIGMIEPIVLVISILVAISIGFYFGYEEGLAVSNIMRGK